MNYQNFRPGCQFDVNPPNLYRQFFLRIVWRVCGLPTRKRNTEIKIIKNGVTPEQYATYVDVLIIMRAMHSA